MLARLAGVDGAAQTLDGSIHEYRDLLRHSEQIGDDRLKVGLRIQHQRRHCGALRGTHARLRAGVAEAALRAAAPLLSSATLRRNASMRLTTLCDGANVF